MEISRVGGIDEAPDAEPDAGGGVKRGRPVDGAWDGPLRLDCLSTPSSRMASDVAHAAGTTADASMLLFALPSDVLYVIACGLSLHAFVTLAGVCRAAREFSWAPELGYAKISEMACAVGGKDMLRAIQSETAMRSEWRATLYLAFARKVQCVELHDHDVLVDAWDVRLTALETHLAITRTTGADLLRAIRWFCRRPSHRDSGFWQVRDVDNARIFVTTGSYLGSSLKGNPVPSLMSIAEGMLALERGSPIYEQIVCAIADNMARDTFERSRASITLAIDVAMELYEGETESYNLSEMVGKRLGFSQAELRFLLDPIVAESAPRVVWQRDDPACQLAWACDRWRSGDGVFRAAVEDIFDRNAGLESGRRGIAPVLYRNARPTERVQADGDGRPIDWDRQNALNIAAMCRGDADLNRRVTDFLDAIPRCGLDTFRRLCQSGTTFPYYVAPILMRRLLTEHEEREDDPPFGQYDTDYSENLFDAFVAWREHVLKSYVAPYEWEIAAKACAAPLRILHSFFYGSKYRDLLRTAAERAFAVLPPHLWTDILAMTIDQPYAFLSEKRSEEVLHDFIRNPLSIVGVDRSDLISAIVERAPAVWNSLPDRAFGGMSRIQKFSHRFGLSYGQRQTLRRRLVASIGERVISGECPFYEAIQRAGLPDDVAAIRSVENDVWLRALALAGDGGDWRETMRRSTQGSANLRNRTEVYIAGTTGTPVLERV